MAFLKVCAAAVLAALILILQAYAAAAGLRTEFNGESAVSFDLNENANRLYFTWEQPPGKWDLTAYDISGNKTEYRCGEYGFLQEYIELESYASRVEIKTYKDCALLRLDAFDEDGAPDWIREWQPPLEKADMLVMTSRMGDEFLYYGGAIPYYISQGKRVQIAYMSRPDAPETAHEMLNALYDAGVRNYPVIADYTDIQAPELSDVAKIYDVTEFTGDIVEQIRRFKPDVIVGPGDYGDGMQMLCYDSLVFADLCSVDAKEFPESAERYGTHAAVKVYLHGYTDPIMMDWGDSLNIARKSFARYESRKNRYLETEGKYDCRKFGLLTTLVGPDKKPESPDFFENISEYGSDVNTADEEERDYAEYPKDRQSGSDSKTEVAASGKTALKKLGIAEMLGVSAICFVGAVIARLRKD